MRPTATTIELGGAEYAVDLPLKSVREIEEIAGEGVFRILGGYYGQRKTYRWEMRDGVPVIAEDLVPEIGAKSAVMREVIRAGLVGGGMAPADAGRLVKKHIDDRPLMEAVPLALAILTALAYGAPEDATDARPPMAAGTETAGSTSGPSTAPLPSSAIAREKSTI